MTNTSAKRKTSIERKIKILRITVALTAFSFVVFLITLTSSRWIRISYVPTHYIAKHKMYVARSTYGIIWECMIGQSQRNSTDETKCDYHQNQVQNTTSAAEQTLIGMIRTMLSFSVIHILLAIITFICGLYSIHDHRYTYKRLTGMIYILTAASLVVCIEVLITIYRHSVDHFPDIYPPSTIRQYDVCFIIAWIIFVQYLVSSLVFFACSRKRKGTFDEATEEEARANQPVNLGR